MFNERVHQHIGIDFAASPYPEGRDLGRGNGRWDNCQTNFDDFRAVYLLGFRYIWNYIQKWVSKIF